MEYDIEQRETPQRLGGEIFQARRLKPRQIGVVDFSDRNGLGVAIRLPQKQAECIANYLAKEPPEKCYFWVYEEERFRGFRGLVLAGPLNEGINKSADLLSDVQMARWFNQWLSPLGEISRVEEIDPTGRISFKVKEDKKVGFTEIWDAFKEEGKKEKEGERRGKRWKKAMGLPSRSTIAEEARTRLKKIIES